MHIYISKGAQRLPATVPQSSSSSDRQCFLEVPLLQVCAVELCPESCSMYAASLLEPFSEDVS